MKFSVIASSLVMICMGMCMGLAFAMLTVNLIEVETQLSELELGAIRYEERRFVESIELLTSAKRKNPFLRDTFYETKSAYVLGRAYMALEQYDKAEPVLKEALKRRVEKFGVGDEYALACRSALLNLYMFQHRFDEIANFFDDEWAKYVADQDNDNPIREDGRWRNRGKEL